MQKVKTAVVGLGKMGLSHFSMVNAHPDVAGVACDGSGFLVDVLSRNIATPIYKSYDDLLAQEPLDAVVIATPSRLHAPMVEAALNKGLHVFCEKPFCLDWADSARLTQLAADKGLVAQVGYHYRYVGAFREMKRLVEAGAIGRITHVLAEAYGPVVLRPKRATWRTDKAEGGGCLYDYAAHPLNLLNWFFGTPDQVIGSHLGQVFSEGTDDEVFSTLRWNDGTHGAAFGQLVGREPPQDVHEDQPDRHQWQALCRPAGMPGLSAQARRGARRLRRGLDGEIHHRADRRPLVLPAWRGIFGPDRRFRLRRARWQIAGLAERFRQRHRDRQDMAMIIENAETGQPVGTARAGAPQVAKKRGWFGR